MRRIEERSLARACVGSTALAALVGIGAAGCAANPVPARTATTTLTAADAPSTPTSNATSNATSTSNATPTSTSTSNATSTATESAMGAKAAYADGTPISAPPPPPPSEGSTRRTWGWILVGLGAEAGLVATTTSFMMLHQKSIRDRECTDKTCTQAGLDANSTLSSLGGWNAGAWALAAVGVGVGAFFVLTAPSSSDGGKTAIGVAPNGSGLGLDLRRQF